ncbi:FAD-dependent monooxygenase [Mycobacterium sp. MBM]|nr:FAD-dependent monooxygenase [Mycobacterium sp. MBM]
MTDTEVLIAGAGPVGLTAAIELARRGVAVRIVDALVEPPQYAKAVGVQPRTLEVFERMGVLRQILDAAVPLRGQIVYVNGEHAGQLDFALPDDVPFGFIGLPQYCTERVLGEELAARGVCVERGVRLTAFEQDADGVSATLAGEGARHTVRARYLVGADGAHSAVRKGLGLTFEGGAFEEQYMLGDVEVDWSQPPGYAIRAMHRSDGTIDDLLVCIPLPGRGRYRMSTLVPPDLSTPDSGEVQHGLEIGDSPELQHIQSVIDRLSPEPATVSNMRWSSKFRISHRIVDAYGRGRVFVAGDAAHIHPPTGAQGMNTGIQDAVNLAWKLALAVSGEAAEGLLDSYDAERRPVGEQVVGRTVRSARDGIGADSEDPEFVIRREAQLLISYADSPIVSVGAGGRAPDARGLSRSAATDPVRLYTVLAGARHTLVLYADDTTNIDLLEVAAAAAQDAAHGLIDVYVVAHPDADADITVLPLLRDAEGDFARAYEVDGTTAIVIRPDGQLGYVGPAAADSLTGYLKRTFA